MAAPLVIAHRGARRDAPENTVEAFALALAQGADGVELDVHRTADGGLVVHHDVDAPGVGVLATLTSAAIRHARPDVPTLDEVLDACVGALVNIEIKNLPGEADYDPDDTAAALVVECLQRRGRADEVLVSSFNLATVNRVRALDAAIPTALLAMRGFEPLDAIDVCVAHGHTAFHPFVGMLGGNVAGAVAEKSHESGLTLNVWTVNDDDELRRLAVAGVDGLITDVPGEARRALGLT